MCWNRYLGATATASHRTSFSWEPLEELLREPNVKDLIRDYHDELSPLKGVAPLDIDWEELLRRDREGRFAVWAAYVQHSENGTLNNTETLKNADATLAGFVSFHLQPHVFYRTTLFAVDAGHYLSPGFRDNSRIGFRMWRTAVAALEERGVKVIMAHDNADRPLMPFFLALGFHPRSTMFWKIIG